MKSYDHTSLGLLATHSGPATAAHPLGFTHFLHHLKLLLPPHPLHPLVVDLPSFSPQQLRDESIPIRCVPPAQRFDPLLQPSSQPVGHHLPIKCRLGQMQRLTRSLDRTLLPLHQIARRLPARRGAYHFFEFTSSSS